MSNQNYLRGRRFEWEVLNSFKKFDHGGFGGRMAGSHGKFDVVWASPKTHLIFFVQCKTKKVDFPLTKIVRKQHPLLSKTRTFELVPEIWTKYLR